MNRLIHTLVPLLAAVLLMAATAACVEPIVPEVPELSGSTRVLPLQVGLPGEGSLTTKATGQEELVVGPRLERTVHYLQIWAFKHQAADETTYDNSEAVCYYNTEPHAEYTDGLIHLMMPMPDDLLDNVGPANPLKLDFYVLINGESVGVPEAGSTLTRKQLKEKVFANVDGSGFGSNPLVTAIPDGTVTGKGEGLPMSGFFNNAGAGFDMTFMNYGFTESQLHEIHEKCEDVPQGSIDPTVFQATSAQISFINTLGVSTWETLWDHLCPDIEANRAISKVRFIFSKAPNMVDENGTEINTEITSIQLIDKTTSDEGPMLPASTYLFPRESGTWTLPASVAYEAINLTGASGAAYLPNAAIQKINDTPLRLRKDSQIVSKIDDTSEKAPNNMTLEEYEAFLTTEKNANHLTERILYLRESDKSAIIARISYKIGTGTAAVSSTVDIPLGTDFHRNRWWTVYTYFMSYTLGFQVTVHPWNCVESQGQQLEEPEEN